MFLYVNVLLVIRQYFFMYTVFSIWWIIECTPPPSFSAGEVEPPTKFSKKGGLTGPQLWEGVAGKEGVTFFREGCNFYQKNKIYNDKKSL